jgi:hypothetical protein
MPETPEPLELEAVWVGADDLPVLFANAFTSVVGPNAVFLTIGAQLPPAIESDSDLEDLRARGYLPVQPIARLALSPQGLDEMIQALENTRTNFRGLTEALNQGNQA